MMFDYFRYQRLGLRTNPFRTLPPDELAAHAIVDPSIPERAAALARGLLQFLGPDGTGKTTHLYVLERHLLQLGRRVRRIRLQFDACSLPDIDADVAVIDCLQRLNLHGRSRLKAYADKHPVIAATHQSFSEWCGRNRLPCETVVLGARDEAWVQEFFRRRLATAATEPWTLQAAGALVDRTGGNPLLIERSLYLTFEKLAKDRMSTRCVTSDLLEFAAPSGLIP